MAFDSVTIGLSKNGDAPQAEWRQDLVAANSIVGSLSSSVGVSTYRWRLIGRPEGSAAGGTGPEPCALGTATTCAFTVDIPGTYIVECLVNGGAPDATIIVAGCAILETVLSPDNLPLRLLGPGETSQDIADPLVAQGWLKMLNRWLKLVATQGASGTSDHLVIVAAGKTADTLSARLVSSDGTVIFTINGNQLDLSASATDNPFGLFYLVGDTHLAPTGLTRKAGPLINYYDAALTDTYAPVVAAATPTGDPGLIVLPGGPYRLKLWCFASEACTAYFTVSMGGYLGPGVIATSAAVAIPQGVSYVAFNLYAASTTDYLITDTTQPLVFKLYAKANTGTATLRICDGAETGTRLSVPFAGNHAYTHTINNIDPLPAASTTVPGLVEFDTTDPQPDGTADPGSSGKAAQSDHVHPLTLAVPKRYYFSNVVSDLTDGSPSQHTLFSLSNSGTSYALSPPGGGLGTLLVDGPLGDPGLAIWPAGVVPATIWARVRNPQTGERYHLDCGTAPQDASLGRATTTSGEYAYQTSPWPGIQTPLLTDTFQQYVVPMSVMTSPQVGQTGTGPTDRLRCQLTGTIEGTTPPSGEVFEVLCMGATPSYLDTLFAAPTGGSVISGDVVNPVAGGDFFLTGSGVGDDDWDLLRAPTTTDSSSVAITSGGGAGVLFDGPVIGYGDPGLAVWPAGNAIVDFWLNVDSNSASFFVSIGRTLHGSGSPTWIVTDQPLGTIASTVPILSPVVFDFPQSVGSIDDGLVIKVTATTTTSCTATLGTGGTNQNKINLPLPPAAATALQASTQAVFVNGSAPPTIGQILTATSDNPVQAKWAAPIGGGLIKSTFLTAKTGYTHTLNALTGTVRLRGKASGGGGGSAGSSDGENTSAGSGGAEGGEFVVTLDTTGISSITAITTGASAAGGAATGNHPGATGADTVCTMNGITYTAKGGLGGSSQPETNALTLVPGANGVQGTNGDINSPGLPGGIAVILAFGASSAGISGAGGGAGGGAARTTNGAGNAGSSYPTGGGGGGALGLSGYSAFYKGGDSSAGYLIVDEYMKVTLPGS